MSGIPQPPYIYHITHVENLSSIIEEDGLWSDAAMLRQGKQMSSIGMDEIKKRRFKLPVKCYPQDCVADYVPFYFCPRSIMLYLIYRANHPELTYREGQGAIVHLEVKLYKAVEWAEADRRRWTFTLSSAGAVLTEFRNRLEELEEIDWDAVTSEDFRDRQVKEGKQAEFLVYEFFPWHLVRRIGVETPSTKRRVLLALSGASYKPVVEILPQWYF